MCEHCCHGAQKPVLQEHAISPALVALMQMRIQFQKMPSECTVNVTKLCHNHYWNCSLICDDKNCNNNKIGGYNTILISLNLSLFFLRKFTANQNNDSTICFHGIETVQDKNFKQSQILYIMNMTLGGKQLHGILHERKKYFFAYCKCIVGVWWVKEWNKSMNDLFWCMSQSFFKSLFIYHYCLCKWFSDTPCLN